jgi:hypothetical protein
MSIIHNNTEEIVVPKLDISQRLHLQDLCNKTANYIDQTDLIRELKHSSILNTEIDAMLKVKKSFDINISEDLEKARMECAIAANFLFTYYTDIFNRILKDTINVDILRKFIHVLKQIEEGSVDQNDASVYIGTVLKELYIDSNLKISEKLDAASAQNESNKQPIVEQNISWKEFKNHQLQKKKEAEKIAQSLKPKRVHL